MNFICRCACLTACHQTKRCFFLVITLFSLVRAQAQVNTIRGRVVDEWGDPIPTVNVSVSNSSEVTITDPDGNYTIKADSSADLIFKMAFHKTKTIKVGSQSTIDVTLEKTSQLTSTVVIIGYGEAEKSDVTGAMSSIQSEDFNTGVINTPDQLFVGKVSGVQVTTPSGEPGGSSNIVIRGNSSIRSNNNPLIVVDGFPLDGRDITAGAFPMGPLGRSTPRSPLNFINPNDIASIEILKDASATAIYGSRGANGVILITTKKGDEGAAFEYGSSVSIANVSKKLDVLNASEFIQAQRDAGIETPADYGADTDWQDEIFQTGITHAHNFAFGSKGKTGGFRFSGTYSNQEGIVKTSNQEKILGRFNANQKLIKDIISMNINVTAARLNDKYVPITATSENQGNLLGAALMANPTLPTHNNDGSILMRQQLYVTNSGDSLNVPGYFSSPVGMLELMDDESVTNRLLSNLGLKAQIMEGLSYRFNLGIDNSNSVRRNFIHPDWVGVLRLADDNGRIGIQELALSSVLNEHLIDYKVDITEDIKFSSLLGYSYQEFVNSNSFIGYKGVDPDLGWDGIALATPIDASDVNGGAGEFPFGSGRQKSKLQSFFGRVYFNLNYKYLITASVRADGSSRFGKNNRYGTFPSTAIAWRISEEDFAPKVFDNLKLRFGWGITGNQEFPNGISQSLLQIDPITQQLARITNSNPDIKWEKTSQINVGIDFGFKNDKINGTIDFFHRNTSDLLVQIVAPQPTAAQFVWDNLDANIINTGIELNLNWYAIDEKDFRWKVSGNLTRYLNNEVKNLKEGQFFETGVLHGVGLTGVNVQRITNGQSLGAFYLRSFDSFDASGNPIFVNGEQRTFSGTALPDMIYGITNSFEYKQFDFAFTFNGMRGNMVYNNTKNGLLAKPLVAVGRNILDSELDQGSTTNSPEASDQFLEDGSFIRLNNLTLGYTIATKKIDWISQIRVFISGQNLFVITDYSGYDPEVNVDKSVNGVPSAGLDYTAFPKARTFTFGLNASF